MVWSSFLQLGRLVTQLQSWSKALSIKKPDQTKLQALRITEMELGDNFRCMTKFIFWNP
jgi:hypothetical protein